MDAVAVVLVPYVEASILLTTLSGCTYEQIYIPLVDAISHPYIAFTVPNI